MTSQRLESLFKDARALGSSAVPRALYEGSKLFGGHRLLFGTTEGGDPVTSPLQRLVPPGKSVAAEMALADADQVLGRGALVFGQRVPIAGASDWVRDPNSAAIWPSERWWKIDIRSDHRLGDVKWTWELGRHRDVVVVARAAALEPESLRWSEGLEQLLRWWIEANPLESSIHWYSNLELSLRLFAWAQVFTLAGDRLSEELRSQLTRHVSQMRRHLWRDLPYTVISMKNNHLMGDALGLQLADRMTGQAHGTRSTRWAEQLWAYQLGRQVQTDGSMVEDSISYHRFVLEMLCVRRLLGDYSPELIQSLSSTSNYLRTLGALEGELPQYGDWDEGRVLATSMSPHDVGNAVVLGLALSGHAIDPDWVDRYDALAWYAPPALETRKTATLPPVRQAGDVSFANVGPWRVWLKGGSAPSHGHADLGHVSASFAGTWVLSDPGTGTYNGPLEVRNGFRVSSAHNVLRPAGLSQIEPHRSFRWLSSPVGKAGEPIALAGRVVLWCVHDAFLRRRPVVGVGRVARAVVISPEGLLVVDWRESGEVSEFAVSIPFGPDVVTNPESIIVGEHTLRVRVPGVARVAHGEEDPFLGWHSATYGSWLPNDWIISEGDSSGPTLWSLGDVEGEVRGDTVQIGELSLSVQWSPVSTTIEVATSAEKVTERLEVSGAQ